MKSGLHRVGGFVSKSRVPGRFTAMPMSIKGLDRVPIALPGPIGTGQQAFLQPLASQKHQKSLDFEGSFLQHYRLSGSFLSSLHISFKTHRPAGRRLPLSCLLRLPADGSPAASEPIWRSAWGAAGIVEENT